MRFGENCKILAKDIWKKDKDRSDLLLTDFKIKTIVVWENSLPSIEDLLLTIKTYSNEL